MPYLDSNSDDGSNESYEPRQEVPATVLRDPPQLDLVQCRCRSCGCSCACSRGGDEQRSATSSIPGDGGGTSSVTSLDSCNGISSIETASDDGMPDGVAGQEGVESHVEVFHTQPRPFIDNLLERLEVEHLQRRPSYVVQWPTSPSPRLSRVDSFMSLVNEPGSDQHSDESSMSASICFGSAGPEAFLPFIGSGVGSGLFVREPLKLGYEQEFCRNMRIGGRGEDGFRFAL